MPKAAPPRHNVKVVDGAIDEPAIDRAVAGKRVRRQLAVEGYVRLAGKIQDDASAFHDRQSSVNSGKCRKRSAGWNLGSADAPFEVVKRRLFRPPRDFYRLAAAVLPRHAPTVSFPQYPHRTPLAMRDVVLSEQQCVVGKLLAAVASEQSQQIGNINGPALVAGHVEDDFATVEHNGAIADLQRLRHRMGDHDGR